MKPKTRSARILSTLLVLALLLGILPMGIAAGLSKGDALQYRASDVTAKAVEGDGIYDVGELTLQKADPSMYDLAGLRSLPTKGVDARLASSQSISFDGELTEEDLTYVEAYAEMLTEPVGIVDLTDSKDDTKFVFVWLQDLPQALESAYQRHGMRNRNYERVREDGRRARSEIRTRRGIDITYEYSVVFSGFAMEATLAQLEDIAAMDGVFAITEVTYEHMDYIPDPNYTTLGNAGARELMQIADLHAAGIDGTGIKVGVIDSGIDIKHPDLIDALKGGYNFAPRGRLNTGGRTADLSTPDGNHGTHVSGTIASQGIMSLGAAPGVDLYMAQVFSPDNTNSASSADITAALEAFSGGNPNPGTYPNINLPKMDVVNMSLGNDYNSAYEAGHVARNNAVVAGVMVVNSAGNNAYPTSNTTDRRNYSLGSGGVSLPISVAASQYGGNPILSYKPTVSNTAGATGTLNFFCENGDSSFSGVFRDGSFGSLETRYITYGPLAPPDTVNTWPRQTYTIEPLVYIAGKGYELHYACPNNVPTPGGTTGSDMTAAEIATLHALPGGSLAGKILVVNRGQAFFEYKCQALRLGAAGLIVINRDEAVIGNLNIGSETSAKDMLIFSAPASFKKTLYDLVQGGQTAYLDPGALAKTAHANQPADFSSIGPVNETAEIKPDIMAPGYSILSTDLGGGYTEMGGTSMSSPWIAAIAALVKQAHPNAAPFEIKARIMNTADINVIEPYAGRLNGAPGYYFNKDGKDISVFEQGAGFVNPKRAVNDAPFIYVTNYDIPTGNTNKSTFDEAKMASFSFGPTMAGSEGEPSWSKKLTATVNGGTVTSVIGSCNRDTRYSNKNIDGAVEIFTEISADGKSFDVWLKINSWACTDQTRGNLYEGYVLAIIDNQLYSLPWATRVGEFKAPQSDYWLVYMDRPIQAVRQTANQDFSPFSSQNLIFFMFEGEDMADSVQLRTSYSIQTGTTYYLDLYLIEWIPSGRLSHRIAVNLGRVSGNNTTLKLSAFIDMYETYFVTWNGQANAISSSGTVSGTASNVPVGAYNIGIPFDGGNVRYYGVLGFVMTSARPTITVEGYKLIGNTISEHEFGYGETEATVKGRLFSDATQLAADMGFYWAGTYLLEYDEIYPVDQSLNVLVDAGSGWELEFYNEDYGVEVPWFCDEDGFFSLTLPVNDDTYFFPDDICPSGVVYCADAFDISHPWQGSTVYMPMLYGALASFQWRPHTYEVDRAEVISANLNNIAGTLTAKFGLQGGYGIPAAIDVNNLTAELYLEGDLEDVLTYAGYDPATGVATWTFTPYKVHSFTYLKLMAIVTYAGYNDETGKNDIITMATATDNTIYLIAASALASVDKLNGNQNKLNIWVDELYSDGSADQQYSSFTINNNAAGNYGVDAYKVYVDTKGNTQIRACDIIAVP